MNHGALPPGAHTGPASKNQRDYNVQGKQTVRKLTLYETGGRFLLIANFKAT